MQDVWVIVTHSIYLKAEILLLGHNLFQITNSQTALSKGHSVLEQLLIQMLSEVDKC
jgi:hypothetical protein